MQPQRRLLLQLHGRQLGWLWLLLLLPLWGHFLLQHLRPLLPLWQLLGLLRRFLGRRLGLGLLGRLLLGLLWGLLGWLLLGRRKWRGLLELLALGLGLFWLQIGLLGVGLLFSIARLFLGVVLFILTVLLIELELAKMLEQVRLSEGEALYRCDIN